MLKYEWDEEEARQACRDAGFEEGYNTGYDTGLLSAIKNLMKSQNWTSTQAMNALNVPVDAQSTYLNRLQPT